VDSEQKYAAARLLYWLIFVHLHGTKRALAASRLILRGAPSEEKGSTLTEPPESRALSKTLKHFSRPELPHIRLVYRSA